MYLNIRIATDQKIFSSFRGHFVTPEYTPSPASIKPNRIVSEPQPLKNSRASEKLTGPRARPLVLLDPRVHASIVFPAADSLFCFGLFLNFFYSLDLAAAAVRCLLFSSAPRVRRRAPPPVRAIHLRRIFASNREITTALAVCRCFFFSVIFVFID